MLRLSLEDAPGIGITVEPADVLRNNVGTMVQLANRVDGIPSAVADRERRIAEAREMVVQAEERLGAPFAYAAPLTDAYERVRAVTTALEENSSRGIAAMTEGESAHQSSAVRASFPAAPASSIMGATSAAVKPVRAHGSAHHLDR